MTRIIECGLNAIYFYSASSLNLLQLVALDNIRLSTDSSNASHIRYVRTKSVAAAVGDATGVGRRRSAITARRKTSVTGTKRSIAQAVDDEIEAGMQVRYHGRVQMNGQRQTVRDVV